MSIRSAERNDMRGRVSAVAPGAPEAHLSDASERLATALAELQERILARWPEATFAVAPAEDEPGMTHLWVSVDVEDTDEVTDALIDRIVELQVDERVPLAVIPIRLTQRSTGAVPEAARKASVQSRY